MSLEVQKCDPSEHEEEIEQVKKRALKDVGSWYPEYAEDVDYEQFECFLVARDGSDIVATGGYRSAGELLRKVRSGGKVAEMKNVHVMPEHQREGLATRITEKLEIMAEENGFDEMILHTTSLQDGAHRFYEDRGYSRAGSLEIMRKGDEQKIFFYRKSL